MTFTSIANINKAKYTKKIYQKVMVIAWNPFRTWD